MIMVKMGEMKKYLATRLGGNAAYPEIDKIRA